MHKKLAYIHHKKHYCCVTYTWTCTAVIIELVCILNESTKVLMPWWLSLVKIGISGSVQSTGFTAAAQVYTSSRHSNSSHHSTQLSCSYMYILRHCCKIVLSIENTHCSCLAKGVLVTNAHFLGLTVCFFIEFVQSQSDWRMIGCYVMLKHIYPMYRWYCQVEK